MISRTLSFGSSGRLSLSLGRLVWEDRKGERRSFPIEEVGFVLLDSERITITNAALQSLAKYNVALVVCGASHLPVAQLLGSNVNSVMAEVAEIQLGVSEAVRGRIWRQVCRQKILNQAELMHRLEAVGAERLVKLANEVKNGDPANCEAQAARIYFQALGPDGFLREREGDWPNAALNYGYAVLRAAMARAIVSSGLLCFRGVHHHNRYNAYALADDLMEPYRPFVDQYVFGKISPFDKPTDKLGSDARARLLQVLTCDVRLGEKRRPLQIALSLTTGSLVRFLRKETNAILLPEFL